MLTIFKLVLAGLIVCPLQTFHAQDLTPRAYFVTPIHSNAIILTYSFVDGDILFDNVLPITDASAKLHIPIVSYFHSLSFFGRSANLVVSLPYGVGHLEGKFIDNETNLYRSGLSDTVIRFSVNLKGGQAMSVDEYRKWKQKTILGVSLKFIAPTGQYDSTKLINVGTNRWAFKPEFGYSRRFGNWVLDSYGAVWFFTTNPEYWSHNEFFPGTRSQSQKPIGAFEGHLGYDVKPRLWISFDSNYWYGGRISQNGVEIPASLREGSRLGVTASFPLSTHQSLKVSVSDGVYARFGGDFKNVSVAWQYSWLGRPN